MRALFRMIENADTFKKLQRSCRIWSPIQIRDSRL